jgi:hypothetical protein
MVADAPTFPEVYGRIDAALKDKRVLIYNSAFDINILKLLLSPSQLADFKTKKALRLLMEWAAQWREIGAIITKIISIFPSWKPPSVGRLHGRF